MIDRTLAAVVAAIVALIVLVVFLEIHDQRAWETFSAAHGCHVVARERGHSSVGYGLSTNGQMGTFVTSTGPKTGWLCDDGVTYWR